MYYKDQPDLNCIRVVWRLIVIQFDSIWIHSLGIGTNCVFINSLRTVYKLLLPIIPLIFVYRFTLEQNSSIHILILLFVSFNVECFEIVIEF